MSFCVNPILPNYSNQHFLALPSPTSVFTPKLLTCAGNPLLTPIFHRDLPENPQVLDSSSAHSLNFCCLYMCWTLRKSPKKEEESPLPSCAHANHKPTKDTTMTTFVYHEGISSFFPASSLRWSFPKTVPAARFATHHSNNQLHKQSALSPREPFVFLL